MCARVGGRGERSEPGPAGWVWAAWEIGRGQDVCKAKILAAESCMADRVSVARVPPAGTGGGSPNSADYQTGVLHTRGAATYRAGALREIAEIRG